MAEVPEKLLVSQPGSENQYLLFSFVKAGPKNYIALEIYERFIKTHKTRLIKFQITMYLETVINE